MNQHKNNPSQNQQPRPQVVGNPSKQDLVVKLEARVAELEKQLLEERAQWQVVYSSVLQYAVSGDTALAAQVLANAQTHAHFCDGNMRNEVARMFNAELQKQNAVREDAISSADHADATKV